MEQKTNDPFETLSDVQSLIVFAGAILFIVTFVLVCIKGFSFLFFNGVILFFISIMLIGIPFAIYAIKKEMAIPPEIRASIKSRRLRYDVESAETQKYRQKRERAERFWDLFSCMALTHILFGRKK